jgi:hypothetical protein
LAKRNKELGISKIVLIVIVTSILSVGCEQKDNSTNLSAEPAIASSTSTAVPLTVTNPIVFTERGTEVDRTFEQISELITNYQTKLIDAININFFASVEPYLVLGSPLYKAQKTLVSNLSSRKIKEHFVSSEIYNYYSLDKNQYKVEVSEKVEVDYPDKGPVTNEYHWLYWIESKDGKLQLSQIEEWKTYQQDMDLRMGGAKADGYYVDELHRNFHIFLEKAINTVDITTIKQLSKSETVVQNFKELISEFRKEGSNYSLSVKPVQEDWETLTFVDELSYQYTDNNQHQQSGSRKLTIQYEEIRERFEGHAVIVKGGSFD